MSKVKQILPIIQQAKQYYDEGFSIIPCHQNKRPAISSWAKYQEVRMSYPQLSKHFTSAVGIGVIAGRVSNGLFFVDFDNKLKNAKTNLEKVTGSLSFKQIIGEQEPVIISTQSGGFHLYFKITDDDEIPGSEKLAFEYDADGTRETSIETRGEGSYVLAPPTKGYEIKNGSLDIIPELSILQLQAILDICKQLDAVAPSNSKTEAAPSAEAKGEKKSKAASKSRNHPLKKLVNDKYNWLAYRLLLEAGWKATDGNDDRKLTRPGKNPSEGCSATFGYQGNPMLYVFSDATGVFEGEKSYTTFEIIANLQFNGNHRNALAYFEDKCGLIEAAKNFIWVGDDFFQIYSQKTPFGTVLEKMDARKKGTIAMRYSNLIFKHIPYYLNFINEPDNVDYKRVIDDNFYNMARPFPHKAKEGPCEATLNFIEHIWGAEQLELGLDYLQLLYLNPKQRLPTLVVVSATRETGKTTFLEYLNNIMVSQSIIMTSDILDSQFNLCYGYKSILMVDEALVRTTRVQEKLKSLATAKVLYINEKFQSRFEIPFYGKLILSGNREEDLLKIDLEENRYWVLKIEKPPKNIIGLAQRLVDEIPGFLYFLQNRKMKIKEAATRLWFPDDLTETKQGSVMKAASLSPTSHEIRNRLHELFCDNDKLKEVLLTATDIKDGWFKSNHQVGSDLIRRLIKSDFGLDTIKSTRYTCLVREDTFFSKEEGFQQIPFSKTGTPFCFKRETICDENNEIINFSA